MEAVFVWMVLGLVSGVLAKILLPGKDKGGIISTTLVGVAGSFLGGFVGSHFGVVSEVGGLTAVSFMTAICGALIVLVGFRLVRVLI